MREVTHVFRDIMNLLQNELPIISTIRLFDLLEEQEKAAQTKLF